MSGNCYEEVQWLAFLDDEINAAQRTAMMRHVDACRPCADRLAQLADLFSWGERGLSGGHAVGAVMDRSRRRQGVRSKLATYGAMRRTKALAAGVAALAAAAVIVAPGPRVWANILQVFRASHVDVVQVSPTDMTNLQNALSQQGKVSMKQYGSVTTVKPMTWQQGTVSGYAAQTGLPDLWPKSLAGGQKINVSTTAASEYVFTLNVAHINALVQSVGGTQLFPSSLSGVPITVNVPAGVDIYDPTSSSFNTGYELQESGVPSVSIPRGAGVSQARQALLALPFLPQPIEQALANTADWQNTLVVPVPGATTQNVSFLGHRAVLISETNSNQNIGNRYSLVWDHGKVIAAFSQQYTGTLSPQQFMRHAKELFG